MNRIFLCIFTVISWISRASEPRFDWSTLLNVPPGSDRTSGNQILHFKASNKPYLDSNEAVAFVEQYLFDALPLTSDAEVLRFGSDCVTLRGIFLELGVCTGRTINFIAALNPLQTVYGFDSFEGLPEDWVRADKTFSAGTFAFKKPENPPAVLHNVHLIKGLFQTTLSDFANTITDPIAFMHIDSDLYSSAATAFELLGDKIVPGTILVFDEFYNYPGSENHEFKAFQEFLSRKSLKAKYLAYNVNHEQVVVQMTE